MNSHRNLLGRHLLLPLFLLLSAILVSCKSPPKPTLSPPNATSEPNPARLTQFLTEIRQLMFLAQIQRAQGPHDLILETNRHYRLLRKTEPSTSTVLGSLPIPQELEVISSPRTVRFHKDGRLSWSGPDITDIITPSIDRGDITIRLIGTDQYGLIDLVPASGRIQLLIKSFR